MSSAGWFLLEGELQPALSRAEVLAQLPGEAVDALSLGVLKSRLDRALGSWAGVWQLSSFYEQAILRLCVIFPSHSFEKGEWESMVEISYILVWDPHQVRENNTVEEEIYSAAAVSACAALPCVQGQKCLKNVIPFTIFHTDILNCIKRPLQTFRIIMLSDFWFAGPLRGILKTFNNANI